MVVGHMTPGGGVMTGAAFAPEPAFVRLVLLVTVHALGLRTPIALPRRVAVLAGNDRVGVVQWEVGSLVIELLAAEFDDVTRPPEVLRMTGVTLRRFDALHAAMKAVLCRDVGRGFLMAVEAQSCLVFAVAAVVAKGALLLVLLVRGTQLSGHEQCLRIDGFTAPDGRQT